MELASRAGQASRDHALILVLALVEYPDGPAAVLGLGVAEPIAHERARGRGGDPPG